MFTGLIQEVGMVEDVQRTADGMRLRIRGAVTGEVHAGDSVAVSGVCLTASDVQDGTFSAEVVGQTMRHCSLGSAAPGASVNLELALRPTDRLGGHVVQGHVDGVGVVVDRREDGFSRLLEIATPPGLLRYVVEHGSIAVDGTSLTVAALGDESFTVALIPETLGRTTLGSLRAGDRVNLEVDVLAKYIERLVAR